MVLPLMLLGSVAEDGFDVTRRASAERRRKDDRARRYPQAFVKEKRTVRQRHVLEHLERQYHVERRVRERQRLTRQEERDVATAERVDVGPVQFAPRRHHRFHQRLGTRPEIEQAQAATGRRRAQLRENGADQAVAVGEVRLER